MNPLLSVEGLNLTIGDRQILKDISFEIYEGEVFTILGGSGSGKTTITKCIVALLKATSGKIEVFGKDISSLSQIELDDLRKRIGLRLSRGALFDSLTVWENVSFYYLEHGKHRREELRSSLSNTLKWLGFQKNTLTSTLLNFQEV